MEKTLDISRPCFSEHIIFASPTAFYKIEVPLWLSLLNFFISFFTLPDTIALTSSHSVSAGSHDLPTIDLESFSRLSSKVDNVTSQINAVTSQVDAITSQVDAICTKDTLAASCAMGNEKSKNGAAHQPLNPVITQSLTVKCSLYYTIY